jgi:hypothetical protein
MGKLRKSLCEIGISKQDANQKYSRKENPKRNNSFNSFFRKNGIEDPNPYIDNNETGYNCEDGLHMIIWNKIVLLIVIYE